ncbi:hypothetical protein COR50_17075 [Chitinophaga caeni]|uniref:UspA domain-containing protein n=2 Tax=Chitinophaga caeni TaxID=2029983 RepID=A0A291QXS9_9BACT|nr:hypothetical protein COR50_17075 [Chitinophaga caeni]
MDALHFREEELDYFYKVSQQLDGELTVLFLRDNTGFAIPASNPTAETDVEFVEQMIQKKMSQQQEAYIEKCKEFIDACNRKNYKVTLQEVHEWSTETIVYESMFADLLLVNYYTTQVPLHEKGISGFIEDVLINASCPVIITPDEYKPIDEIVFTYNGTKSSMFAIKRWTQIFQNLDEIPIRVIYVEENNSKEVPGKSFLDKYLSVHFKNVSYMKLEGEPSNAIYSFLAHKVNCMVTFGAFGRSRLSRFFRKSQSEKVIKMLNIPIFVTHP